MPLFSVCVAHTPPLFCPLRCVVAAPAHHDRLPQAPCHRFDPRALFKSWFFKIIAIGPTLVAYGSTKDKAMCRAMGGDGAMGCIEKAVPITACSVTSLGNHLRRPNIMVVRTSADSSCDQIFAFESAYAREKIARLLQVHSFICSLCLCDG